MFTNLRSSLEREKITSCHVYYAESTFAFFFLLFDDFDVPIKEDELRLPVFDDVPADPPPVAPPLPDGNESGAPPVGVVGVLGGVGVELLLVDIDGVEMKGRLIFEALFSRSSGMTAESSSLLSMSFFTSNAKSTISQVAKESNYLRKQYFDTLVLVVFFSDKITLG